MSERNDLMIDDDMLDTVQSVAKTSGRLRVHYDLRNTECDLSCRMLNVLEVGTPMPIHRHRNTSETIVLMRGHIIEHFYDDSGNIVAEYDLNPDMGRYGLQIPKGVWHGFDVVAPSALFEAKDGAYTPCLPCDILSNGDTY